MKKITIISMVVFCLMLSGCVSIMEKVKFDSIDEKDLAKIYSGNVRDQVILFYKNLKPRVDDFNKSADEYNTALKVTYAWGLINGIGTLAISAISKGLNDSGKTTEAGNTTLWGGIIFSISTGSMTISGLDGQRDIKANKLKMKYTYLQTIVDKFNTLSNDLINNDTNTDSNGKTKREIANQKLIELNQSIQNGFLQPNPFTEIK